MDLGDDVDDGLGQAGSPVMPAIAYPSHILFAPPKAFLTVIGFWMVVMIFTIQPVIFLAGWIPSHLVLVWLYYRDPYFVEVLQAWWTSGLWPRSRRTRNLYPTRGNKYVG